MSGSAPGRREVAYRVFAAEFDDATVAYSESDEERAPNYVVTPTGARVNRLFAVGVLTEVTDVNPEMVRGRVVDPTGAVVSYAGQYQPDALAFLERADPPTFVALSGKARTFEPDDADVVYSSVRPESVNAVEADVRDRWVVTAAERTLDRIGVIAAAIEAELTGDELRAALEEAGVDERLADGVALALEYYDTTPAYLGALRVTALNAVRVVADEREEAGRLEVRPADAGGPEAPTAADLATLDLSGLPTTPLDTADERTATAEEVTPDATTTEDPDSIDVSAPTAAPEPTDEAPADAGGVDADAADDTGADDVAAPTTDTDGASAAEPDETTDGAAASQPDADGERSVDHREATGAGGPGDFEPGEFDLDEETREAVEEEYGTEFLTADEVQPTDVEAEESDAEPDGEEGPGEPAAEDADDSGTVEAGEDTAVASETADHAGEAAEARSATGGVDLEDAVIDAMESVGDEAGADREALVAAVVEEQGVDPAAVEAAIEDALMSGRCYEPSEGTLKAI